MNLLIQKNVINFFVQKPNFFDKYFKCVLISNKIILIEIFSNFFHSQTSIMLP